MTQQKLIEGTNLSTAWCEITDIVLKTSGSEITPLLLSLTNFEETPVVRQTLDKHLDNNKKGSVQTVSETIFPNSLYQLAGNRHNLYKDYLDILPRIKEIDASSNGRGTYFERLIAYDGNGRKINQLEMIISSLQSKKIKRRSKFQASIFDVTKDNSDGPYQRFPCLQHVTFYVSENGGLVLNSFYAIQYLYERAYGNWLGLINLGRFVAQELGMELERFNCCIGVEKLEITKVEAAKILKKSKYN